MMKRINVNKGTIATITRNGDYNRVLTAGKHWIRMNDEVTIYNMSTLYMVDNNFKLKIQDDNFAKLIEVSNVADNELKFMYEDGLFSTVLTAGKYFYIKGLTDFEFKNVSLYNIDIIQDIENSLFTRSSIKPFISEFQVSVNEVGLLFVDGKLDRKLKRGTYHFWKNNQTVSMIKVDLRQLQIELSGQEILTKDKAALRINFFALYKVIDVEKTIIETKDYEKQLYMLIQLGLRAFIGSLTLDELLDNKQQVADYIMNSMQSKVKTIGIELLDAGVRDIILPGDMKEIMNQVLVAQKRAQANIITRREETASTRSLLNTAKLMEDNDMLFQLKEMEYMEKIAGKIGEISVSGGGQILDQMKTMFTK